ncbi:hypothetical protein HDU79_004330 [Rhizoclosmatium sp. JEL0117]|nr:hypothetical protein HDU79_004330 [Rhizoclosmatium sp. JEL0117]
MTSIIRVVGRGSSAGPKGSIIVEAGWNTTNSFLEGAVLLKVESKLKSLRIQTELKGTCETRWENANATKLATKYESDSYKVLKHSRVFQHSFDLVFETKEVISPDQSGAPVSFPMKFKIIGNDMPPSFNHPSGSVWYTLKVSASFFEGKSFVKTTVEMEVPVTIIMPEAAKLMLLRSPNPVDQSVVPSSNVCGYSLQMPTTVVKIGETLQINLSINSTPDFGRLKGFSGSLHVAAGFTSSNKEVMYARRQVGEYVEAFPLVKIGGNGGVNPIFRTFELKVDPEGALASFWSQLIAVTNIFLLQIITEDSDTPNVHVEVPITVLPQPIDKAAAGESAPATPVVSTVFSTPVVSTPVVSPAPKPLPMQPVQPVQQSPSLVRSPLPSPPPYSTTATTPIQTMAQPVYQVPMPKSNPPTSPALSPKQPIQQLSPFEEQLAELQRLKDEQAKLSILLAEIQKLEMPQSRSLSQYDPSVLRARSVAEDTDSILSQEPTADWTVEMVAEWVKQKGASEEVVQSFKTQEIDGSILVTLTADDLRNELKVTALGLRRKILMAIEKLRG